MPATGLVLSLSVGGAILALWTDLRYQGLAPDGVRSRLVHVFVSLTVLQFLAPPAVGIVVGAGQSVPSELLALFLVYLPVQIYAWLAAIWILRTLHAALQTR
jgi:hypothetical protein